MVWLVGSILGLTALYLFLIAPNVFSRKARTQFLGRWAYAHRGLHGEKTPENSLAAFQLAADRGYGIELDVRWTKDRVMVVHHDDSLLRMCGVDRKISEMTGGEVLRCQLKGSPEYVPTLDQVLDKVNGKVPLIIEMKSGPQAAKGLPEMLYRRLQRYPGMYCVESFDPRMVRWFKKHAPHVVRGQLAFDPHRGAYGQFRGLRYRIGAHLLMNALSRPDFVAYDYETAGNLSFRMMRAVYAPVLAAWTVRSEETFEQLKGEYAIRIFEGFEPNSVCIN